MRHTNLTRWIEIADERHFHETAMLDRLPGRGEQHHYHFGLAIFGLPGRLFASLGHRARRSCGR
jgi:hypothetical protein